MTIVRSEIVPFWLRSLLALFLILSGLLSGTAMAQRTLSNGQHLYLPIYSVIQWEAEVPASPPLVQALHVELQTNRAIVFTTDAVLIPR